MDRQPSQGVPEPSHFSHLSSVLWTMDYQPPTVNLLRRARAISLLASISGAVRPLTSGFWPLTTVCRIITPYFTDYSPLLACI